jgi:hypothetical protein
VFFDVNLLGKQMACGFLMRGDEKLKSDKYVQHTEKKTSLALPLAALGLAGTLYAASVNRRRKTAVSSHSNLMDFVEQKCTSISVAWPDQGGLYRVYRDKQLIYTGLEPKMTDRDLIPGTLYTYCIEMIDEHENVVERMKIQTATAVDYKDQDNVLQDLILTTIVAKGQISLEWEPIEGVSEYSIYRNGVKLETVGFCSYTDESVNNTEPFTYTIKAKRPLQRSDQMKWEIKSVVANAVGMIKKDSSTELAANEEFTITKKLESINQLLNTSDNQEKTNKGGLWQLRYTTFLKERWLKNPNATSVDHFFKGDDRSYDPGATRFRTRADIFIDAENPSALLSKEIGKTEAFNKNEEFIEEAQASEEGIKLEKVLTDDDKIMFYLHHSVSNPLVLSPAIDYLLCGTFYKNGQFDLVGIHDQAPNHEIYVKVSGTDNWAPIHQAKSKGLEMMADTLANHYWRYSTFTN